MARSKATTQRVENFIKNFMQYHNNGYSVKEIADIFKIDFSTGYKKLQEIADANGVTRESLLEKKAYTGYSRLPFYKEKVDVEELMSEFDKVDEGLDNLISKIADILTKTKE